MIVETGTISALQGYSLRVILYSEQYFCVWNMVEVIYNTHVYGFSK